MDSKNFLAKTTGFITLDKYGKVVVQDNNLVQVSEELTLDELEKVSGAGNTNCVNIICDPGFIC